MRETKFIIVNSGMGGFLNPPNHAEHSYGVEEYVNGRSSGSMSLTSALEDVYVSDEVKEEARRLLKENAGEFTEEWEHSCYNYFRNCYSPDGANRKASDCIISKECINPEYHLAYLHIKSFFPDYKPNEFLINNNGDKGSWSKSK